MAALAGDINFIIRAMVTGALLWASVYHTMLFFQNKIGVVGHYSFYLERSQTMHQWSWLLSPN